jgi:hypothetical protein
VTKVNSDLSSRHPIRLRLSRTGQGLGAEQHRSSESSTATSTTPTQSPDHTRSPDSMGRDSMGPDVMSADLMSPELNVQRIMHTGTIWFAAAIGSVAVTMGLLLSSGWRPEVLMGGERALWWAGSAIVALSIGLIGWSGCPILEVDVPTASRNKSRTMQLGTMLFIVGSTFALFAVLLGPAA